MKRAYKADPLLVGIQAACLLAILGIVSSGFLNLSGTVRTINNSIESSKANANAMIYNGGAK